ncbi:DUF2201 family putative metallopeptidase, partial [Streptomyces ipomoeae]
MSTTDTMGSANSAMGPTPAIDPADVTSPTGATDPADAMSTTDPTDSTAPTDSTDSTDAMPSTGSTRPTADTPKPLDLDKLFTARLQAARARPYLATALFALHTVESRRVPTMAVDRYWRCYVSPVFVDRTPVEELAGVWVHEVSHL